ncbi:transporter [Amycolatopsis anabasis]|uniref:PH-like domain-containing protein n=1 Tax=Amycolatopsis anabasis TaxID=1840409 RepID=UPI00131C2E89|nr:transporter [Amycolatopsis anabasis]
MDRLWLTLAVVAFFALCVWGMWLGWRRKARSQSVQVPPFPSAPDNLGEPVLPPARGLYVSTTRAGHWQDRIVTRGAGLRTSATWRLYESGLEVERVGAPGFWIPAESIVDVRRDRAIAGKVMGSDSLLVITWQLSDVLLDTGFRGDDLGAYPQWMERLRAIAPERKNGDEVKGGAQT